MLARSRDVDEAVREFKRFKEEPEKKVKTMTDGNGKYCVAHGDDELIVRAKRERGSKQA